MSKLVGDHGVVASHEGIAVVTTHKNVRGIPMRRAIGWIVIRSKFEGVSMLACPFGIWSYCFFCAADTVTYYLA